MTCNLMADYGLPYPCRESMADAKPRQWCMGCQRTWDHQILMWEHVDGSGLQGWSCTCGESGSGYDSDESIDAVVDEHQALFE